MRNFRLIIEYDGTNYSGWQKQKKGGDLITVQGSIEKIIRRIFGDKISLIGAGRTDRGVHALGQVGNFKARTKLKPFDIRNAINAYLPDDILIREVKEMSLEFHSRFNAVKKWYRYTILRSQKINLDFGSDVQIPSVFFRNFALYYPYPLNLGLIKEALKLVKGRHNFSGIACGKIDRNTVREIYKSRFKSTDNFIYIDIIGNGFLYKMVRRIIGMLIDAGRGKITLDNVRNILLGDQHNFHIKTMPACGLCLMQVFYSVR